MKLNPQQAPLYGECVLTVQLNDEECVEDEEDVEFYLLFAGTTQRHLTTTLRVSHVTLQAVCPAHDCGETVQVTLCLARPGGSVDAVAEERFQFVQDLALDMAHFLLSASGQRDGLEGALLLDECQIPLQECERLDETLALALRHIPLPAGWSVLGTDINTHSNTDPGPHETLLHFAARRGLRRVALFLLQQPGGREALRHQNKQGHTPAGVALKRGHSQLQHLLSDLEKSPRFEAKAARPRFPGGRAFLHHPKLNTFTLTVDSDVDASPLDLRTDVEELQRFVQSHQQQKELSEIEPQPVSLILSRDICDGSQKAVRTSCPGPSQQSLPVCEHREAERENGPLPNGTGEHIRSEEPEKVDPDSSAGDGVCGGGEEERAAISGASCGELQQEEADREVCVITAKQRDHFSNKTHNKAQSGNLEEAAMGQSQGLHPSETKHGYERSEESRRWDLPEEKEAVLSRGQETADLSELRKDDSEEGSEEQAGSCLDGTEAGSELLGANQGRICEETGSFNTEKLSVSEVSEESGQNSSKAETEGNRHVGSSLLGSDFGVNPEVDASELSEETLGCSESGDEPPSSSKKDTGNRGAAIEAQQDEGLTALDRDSLLEFLSLRPNMAPGPVHKVRREASPLPDCRKPEETAAEETESSVGPGEQHQLISQTPVAPAESASGCEEPVRNSDSFRDPTDGAAPSEHGAEEGHGGTSNKEKQHERLSEEGNGEVALDKATPGGGDQPLTETSPVGSCGEAKPAVGEPSSGVSEAGSPPEVAGGGREDASPSSEAGVGETSSEKSEDSSPSNQATVGETSSQGKDDEPSSDGVSAGETLPVAGFGEPSKTREDPPPSFEMAVGETVPEGGKEASPSAEADVGETSSQRHEVGSSSKEAGVEEPPASTLNATEESSGGNKALSETQRDSGLLEDHIQGPGGPQNPQNEALAVDQTPEVPAPLNSSEATVDTSVNPETISLNQPEESIGEMESEACEMPSSSPCSSMPKESSTGITVDQLTEERGLQPLRSLAQTPGQTDQAMLTSSDSHTPSAGLSETREECVKPNDERVSSNIALQECDSPLTSPCDGISLDPQSESSGAEGHAVSPAAAGERSSDPGCSSHDASTQPLEQTSPPDTDSGTVLGLNTSTLVEMGGGSSHDLPPPDTCGSLNSRANRTEGERREEEEPHEDQAADDLRGRAGDAQASSIDMDQTVIHRETEVFYPLESCPDVQEQKELPSVENASTDGRAEGVCRSVSVSSVTEWEAVSDGDSLLSTEMTDDSVFKQSEDTVTLAADSTSGISITGSSSTDDSSSLEPCGSEPQPAEGALMVGSEQPVGSSPSLDSDQPVEDVLSGGSDQPDEGTLTPKSDQTVGGTPVPDTDQPVEGVPPTSGETEEEEQKDRLTEVPERSAILRSSVRSLSPSRRHSWGPVRNSGGEAEMVQRSEVPRVDGGKPAGHRRSMSWCPSDVARPATDEMNARSYSLEGLAEGDVGTSSGLQQAESQQESSRPRRLDSEERGSLVSLTEEELESDMGDVSSLTSQRSVQGGRRCAPPPPLTLMKSVSMSAISPRDLDDLGSFTRTAESLAYSISEEDPGPLRSDSSESRVGGTKVSRTFSYLKSKMTKKSKEKDREKNKDGKEKEKRSSSGHLFSSVSTAPPGPCLQCSKPINTKDALQCANCSANVHKGCREGLPVCAKVKMKQQTVPDSASASGVALRSKAAAARDRPWSTFVVADDQMPPPVPPPRRSPCIMTFNSIPLSKSISISNIAGQMDDAPLKPVKFLSQSTDSLHTQVNESTESLTDEGAELMDGQLMGDFEADAKELEADSWSLTVDKKYLKQLKKDVVKRQDVIYELIQTEMHHVRTLRIMADVYSKGLQKEVQLEPQTLEMMFPVLEELMDVHTLFFTHLLERKRAEQAESGAEGGYTIRRVGDVLLEQVTGSNAERMTKVYGKFCSRHNEAVNLYKELHAKDKRFQAFIRKMMSSSIVRRLSIPECILLVTQRLTKYPVLLQRILQHTKDPEQEQVDMAEALQQVKEVIAAVDLKVSEYEKRRRLKEIHSRTDSKSIMRMKSGQMFAREDLIRGRRLVHDGPLQLKNTAGRLKDVQALLLSDVFVFLQEKDQKYAFASLDQRSTVISLRKLIVREVANEERGLFLITAGMENPEMVEVYASSKVERNTWIQLIQNTMQSIEKEDDEGIPSETEEDKRLQEVKAKEMRDQLQKKDGQIVSLLEEKVRLFRELCECGPAEEAALRGRMLFRATTDEVTKGEPIISDALKEVEKLQELVTGSVCGAVGQQVCAGQEGVCVSSVSLPRRAETFGGFDSHQMNISKTKDGEREETDESVDLRRTESDSVLKKGGSANLLLLLKRNSEQVLHSVTRLHDLLNALQAVVVQQDSFIEDQRQVLTERPSAASHHPSLSSSSSTSSSSSRPASLIEQEKQRSAERLRQEAEERRRKEKDWEQREKEMLQREERLHALEQENAGRSKELEEERSDLQNRKEEYQRDLARLRDGQRRLEREREQLYIHPQNAEDPLHPRQRTSSSASEDSLKFQSSMDPAECVELSSSPSSHDLLTRLDSKRKSKNLSLFSSGSGQKAGAMAEPQSQMPTRLLQLAKPKEKKEKKKKKGKGQQNQPTESQGAAEAGSVFFC